MAVVVQAVNGDGSPATPVGTLALWQMHNGKLDALLRVGLPVAAWYLWGRHRTAAYVAAGGAALLWANRLTGINL